MIGKVLFLDFDGVLNGLETREPPSPVHAGLFLNPVLVGRANAVCERTGAVVVLSTSWRNRIDATGCSLDIATALRGVGLSVEIVGTTPDLSRKDTITRDGETIELWRAPERRHEIAAWIEQHKPDAFVILDDDRGAEIAGHFVWCDPKRGLSTEGVEMAVRILGETR